MSPNLLYLELNSVCLLLLLWILYTVRRNEDFQTRNMVFYREVALTMGILLLDVLWISVNGLGGKAFYIVNQITNVLYYIASCAICIVWGLFSVYSFSRHLARNKIFEALLFVPHLVLCLLAISSPWTHFTFYVDSRNVYHRGTFIWVHECVIYLYMFVTFGFMLYAMFRQRALRKNNRPLVTIISIAVIVFGGGSAMFLLHGFDSLWPLFSVVLFVVYTDIQMERISMDALTGLSNRAYFDRRIAMATTTPRPEGKELYLYMLDVDFFKKINDNYGHLEGDEALRNTAAILQKVFTGEHTVLARYGGDEFACLWYCESEQDAEAQRDRVMEAFRQRNMSTNEAFPINVSVGFARFGVNGVHNDIELVNAADEALYRIKQVNHRKVRRRR